MPNIIYLYAFIVEVTCSFDDLHSRLFIAFRYTLLMLEIQPEVTDRVMTHSKPVVSAKFNKNSNQVKIINVSK